MDVTDWRKKIDEIDRQLLALLNERARCVLEIGAIKKRTGTPVHEPAREREILENVTRANGGPLDHEAVKRLFERIIDEGRSIERISIEARRKD